MNIIQFLKSKAFLKQLGLAVVAVIVICFLMLKWLKYNTNHGEFVKVPDLTGKSLDIAQMEIDDQDLRMVVQDSANYNPNYPKYSVIEQQPNAGASVKENRKIYLTLNPSGYRKVGLPDVVRQTFRQAKPTIEALGLEVGRISYKNDIGKDEVLEVTYKGKIVKAGTLLEKTSKVDLVLGNGKRGSN
ncbi:MAG: PASTA domain-containing protein [Flavobacteriaceae bacterium]|nr:PASTA domain-containing protein [Flavobacteriaceae bacterium]